MEDGTLRADYHLTEDPEQGGEMVLILSWWHHSRPQSEEARQLAASYRKFIRVHGLHLRGNLRDLEGRETTLEVNGTTGRMLRHPLDAALVDAGAGLPVPDPLPLDMGVALRRKRKALYVLLAAPQDRQPTLGMVSEVLHEDPASVGMGFVRARLDAAARDQYQEPAMRLDLRDAVAREQDVSLRAGLRLLFGINPED